VTEAQKRWPSFGYIQVPGLANRLISRYLRTQRKNMLRFFQERGLYALAERMKQIRNSRQGMLAKNRYFQQVLNEYSKLATPATATVTSVLEACYNRRRPQSSPYRKPLISRLPGTSTWVCRYRSNTGVHGYGLTPMLAYLSWREYLC
jgi:hypothetical protein